MTHPTPLPEVDGGKYFHIIAKLYFSAVKWFFKKSFVLNEIYRKVNLECHLLEAQSSLYQFKTYFQIK